MDNPILNLKGLPLFSQIKPEHIQPAIEQLLNEGRKQIQQLLDNNGDYSWQNLAQPLEELDDRISRAWSPIAHLHSVVNSDALHEAYSACLPLLSDYNTEVAQNPQLCEAFKQLEARGDQLTAPQRKIIANTLRDFRLSGIDLPPEGRERYKLIVQALSQLANEFSQNLLDATDGWKLQITDETRLAGLPESARNLARQAAEQAGIDGWLIKLEFPYYLPVMSYADDRELRRELYSAYVTRASDEGPNAGEWDNGPIMEQILSLRHEMAQLLGFDNYAEYSLATKMAADTDQVIRFLHDLAERSLPMAKKEISALRAFAKQQNGLDNLEAWDITYYSEKLRQHQYAISQEDIKPYFPENRVISGMFDTVNRLFGITIRQIEDIDSWHPDVRFFEIRDSDNTLRGQFYLDLYAREKKRGGAWMDDCICRRSDSSGVQHPVAYLVCNFTPPIGDDPALLTHDEVQTLFHEFGHGLHHMLTQIDYPSIAGISGVAWDAVELPSQFLENWCWQREALDLFAAHYQTGEKIPDALFNKMIAAKNFQSGMQMVRQLEFSLFDFRMHREYDPEGEANIYTLLDEVRQQVAVIKPPSFNRFPHSFGHIFAGGYAAGYYSYKWAEVLSSDAFSLFEENGIFDAETGERFLCAILEQGGSKEPMELFIAFRGREPTIDALLRHSGISVCKV
ncbi:Oligopeptidase A [hydrothermal vent metagenome]|uniref:oligopeptidase A n=1 Tax=hydrothermal vent metagenome TaxID=652676 RepID=A0A3B0ZRM0_9ZZZZ